MNEANYTITEHRLRDALLYLAAVGDVGVYAEHLNAFIDDRYASAFGLSSLDLVVNSHRRDVAARTLKLGWADIGDDGRLKPSELALSLAERTHRETEDAEVSVVSEIMLSKDDPVAWATLADKLGSFDKFLLVDPYFEWEDLVRFEHTSLQRILLTKKAKLAGISNVLIDGQQEEGELEIRRAPQRELHDRYVITDDDVWGLTGSLNGLGKNTAVFIQMRDHVEVIRAEIEAAWDKSTVVWPRQEAGDSQGK